MTIFAVYNFSTLMCLFRNKLDAEWFMQTSNENIPLQLKEILIEDELDNIWQSDNE